MITACTNPNAPFYEIDLLILRFFEGYPCEVPMIAVIMLTSVCLLGLKMCLFRG